MAMHKVLDVLAGIYQRLDSLPEDPSEMVCYGKFTSGAKIIVQVFPRPASEAMPFEHPEAVVHGIHEALDGDQGLVEVESGETNSGGKFIYSIVKTAIQPRGVQYCLTFHLLSGGELAVLQGFLSESGTTGVRDSSVFLLARRTGMVSMPDMAGWTKDPYDSSRKQGFLMNLSEMKEFDHLFPRHPLSEARELIRRIVAEA